MGMRLSKELEGKVLAAEIPRPFVPHTAGAAGDLYGVFLAVGQAGFPPPVPEVRFHPGRHWRFDWAWPWHEVALEREGGCFVKDKCPNCSWHRTTFKSRHHDRKGYEADLAKYNEAARMGWLLVRVTPPMIRDGRAADAIIGALRARNKPCV